MMSIAISVAADAQSNNQAFLFQFRIFFPSHTNPPAACIGIRLKIAIIKLRMKPALAASNTSSTLAVAKRPKKMKARTKLVRGPQANMIPVLSFGS